MADYAHPEVLVSTDWIENHAADPSVRIVEVDVDTKEFDHGHIPGAIAWDWTTQLCDTVQRDILAKSQFQSLMSESGIGNDTTVVLYGDNNNWFAAWAFWQMKIYGHADVRLLNGGRRKWLSEGRELTLDVNPVPPSAYQPKCADFETRAFLPEVLAAVRMKSPGLVDVRTPEEFSGELLAPAGLPETCQRGGHIPGACNIPWESACAKDGTFLPIEDLEQVYGAAGLDRAKTVLTYCRIGERSSHTWFVLQYLLGFRKVKNYDGSWTEWGNLVGAPVERGLPGLAI